MYIFINGNLILLPSILCGDLNSCTSFTDDFIAHTDNIPELYEEADILNNDIGIGIYSCDKILNKFGRQLLKFCKTY